MAAGEVDRPNGDFVVGMSNGDNQTDPKTDIALGFRERKEGHEKRERETDSPNSLPA